MKRNVLRASIVMVLGIFFLSGISFAAEETEEITIDAKVVNIDINKGLSPATVTAKRGTTVIWINNSRVPQEILFLDKKVVLSCGAPVNFCVGKDGAYESAKIQFGGAASLCFIEKGTYEYEARSSKTFYESYSPVKRELKGSIVIQ
jgi:plastocyanin